MSDEEIYLAATQEVDSGDVQPAIWAKAMAQENGDEAKARYKYIALRVEQLASATVHADEEGVAHSEDIEYLPIAEFAEFMGLSEEELISMIRDGLYDGHIKDEKWYVHRDEFSSKDKKDKKDKNKNADRSRLKTVGIALLFLVPALLAQSVITIILVAIDFAGDPGYAVGISLWGFWALFCGLYFDSTRFKIAGLAMLGFALLSLAA